MVSVIPVHLYLAEVLVRQAAKTMNPKDIVRDGYDRVSYAYRGDEAGADGAGLPQYTQWMSELMPLLPGGAPVLELGCGCGLPVAKRLAERFSVIGVDISPVQVGRAQIAVPDARFLCADMTKLVFPAQTFAAVVSLYALIHVPLEEQKGLFADIHRWLRPGGYFMATVGHRAWTGTEDDWLGVEGGTMYWSHADVATYQTWLSQTGFAVCWTRFIPEGDGGHTLLLAQSELA